MRSPILHSRRCERFGDSAVFFSLTRLLCGHFLPKMAWGFWEFLAELGKGRVIFLTGKVSKEYTNKKNS